MDQGAAGLAAVSVAIPGWVVPILLIVVVIAVWKLGKLLFALFG